LLIFTTVGAHIAMVGAAMAAILLTGFRTLGGRLSSRNRDGISAVALYWYVSVGVFTVLWYAVYVTK
jgi:heme/copper-type cytochrome/quinol oxidase subunit 3